jgi:cell wall-associated NlpC family hydrolase
MVGEDTQMKKTFAEIIGEYLGKPFKPGGRGNGGYGCIDLCYDILIALGKHPPDVFGELSLDNYSICLGGNRELEHGALLEVAKNIGKDIPIDAILPGDGLLIKTSEGGVLTAIYCGQGKAITSQPGIGVTAFAIDENNQIMMARRFD